MIAIKSFHDFTNDFAPSSCSWVAIASTSIPACVVEDGRIRGEPGHRQLVDVLFERACAQEIACNVVEPQALTQIVKQLCRFHDVASRSQPPSHADHAPEVFSLVIRLPTSVPVTGCQ
jgi:hypothetical protein